MKDRAVAVCLVAIGALETAWAVFWLAVGLGVVWLAFGP